MIDNASLTRSLGKYCDTNPRQFSAGRGPPPSLGGAVVVVVVFVDVVMRYAFNTSFVFTQELEWHLFAMVFLFGIAYGLKEDGHVRVDVLYDRFSPRNKAIRAWWECAMDKYSVSFSSRANSCS